MYQVTSIQVYFTNLSAARSLLRKGFLSFDLGPLGRIFQTNDKGRVIRYNETNSTNERINSNLFKIVPS